MGGGGARNEGISEGQRYDYRGQDEGTNGNCKKREKAVWGKDSKYTVKKVSHFPVSIRDVTYQALPGRE